MGADRRGGKGEAAKPLLRLTAGEYPAREGPSPSGTELLEGVPHTTPARGGAACAPRPSG